MSNPERMCPECLTTDAAFPLIEGCKSCKETLAHDEFVFWNTPIYTESGVARDGSTARINVTPALIIRRVVQPWKAFFDLITLT